MSDIIIAAATPLKNSPRAIVRLSGSGCQELVFNQVKLRDGTGPVRRARFQPPFSQIPLWLYLFKEGASYTAEEMCELHVPGNPIFVLKLIDHLVALGCRRADPGEFTRRALRNGRLSLEEAQAIIQVIQAKSVKEHQRAIDILSLPHKKILSSLQKKVQDALVKIETELDFDEDDQGLLGPDYLSNLILELYSQWSKINSKVSRKREPRVVFSGPVNIGKSTLFNLLGGSAVTSPVAGTTRDYLEVSLNWDGFQFVLVDTPGLKGPDDVIDQKAKQIAQIVKDRATLMVQLDRLGSETPETDWLTCADEKPLPWPARALSSKTGYGIDSFKSWILQKLRGFHSLSYFDENHIREVENLFRQMQEDLNGPLAQDMIVFSTHLRELLRLLNPLGTRVHPDEVLHDLFSRFCVGK